MDTLPGRVITSAQEPRNKTPNWLKALYAVLAALVTIVALSLIFGG